LTAAIVPADKLPTEPVPALKLAVVTLVALNVPADKLVAVALVALMVKALKLPTVPEAFVVQSGPPNNPAPQATVSAAAAYDFVGAIKTGSIATGNVITKPELTNKVARVLLTLVLTIRWVVVTLVIFTPCNHLFSEFTYICRLKNMHLKQTFLRYLRIS